MSDDSEINKLQPLEYYENKASDFDDEDIEYLYNKFKEIDKTNHNVDYEYLNIDCLDCENCMFCINCTDCKNSWNCINSIKLNNCYACNDCYKSSDCNECNMCKKSEHCYKCIRCDNCERCDNSYKLHGYRYSSYRYGIIEIFDSPKFEPKNLNPYLATLSKLYNDYYNEGRDIINDNDITDKIEDFENFNKISDRFNLTKLLTSIIQLHSIGIQNKFMNDMIYNFNYLKLNECTEILGAFGVINLQGDVK